MEAWIDWARGPLFWAAITFMVLGLLRHVLLMSFQIRRAYRRAGDKAVPYSQVAWATFHWLVPFRRAQHRLVLSLTSVLFHVSVIAVPLLVAGHVALIERGTGLGWPALPGLAADVLTIVAVVTAAALVMQRAVAKASRRLSRFQDYALPVIIAVPFATGFLAMHPAMNPFSFDATMLVHVLSADAVLILIPLTKISHCALLPFTQLASQIAWQFPPDAGSKVGAVLGKEGEPV